MLHGPYTILIFNRFVNSNALGSYWRYDIVSAIASMLTAVTGTVPLSKVYTGFSKPAVVTVACAMIISQVITHSGAVSFIVRKIAFATKSQTLCVMILSVITATLSAFMNNVGALVLMMSVAIRFIPQSKTFALTCINAYCISIRYGRIDHHDRNAAQLTNFFL